MLLSARFQVLKLACLQRNLFSTGISVLRERLLIEQSDRREARRFVMSLPVRVMVREANGGELKAQTRDVSYRGLYFRTDAKLDSGSEIDFVLTLPQQIITAGDVDIRCHGRVVRAASGENGTHGIAARIARYEFVPSRASAA